MDENIYLKEQKMLIEQKNSRGDASEKSSSDAFARHA